MKKQLTIVFLSLTVSAFAFGQVHLGGKFTPKKTLIKPDSAYFGDIGIRAAWIAPDLDKDGKPEVIVTDYTKSGRVHMFQAAGNDTLEWIWSSPRLDTVPGYGSGLSSTPRRVVSGDMDGDGKGEIIFPRAGGTVNPGGYLVFEWDGVNGSHKFGVKPSAFIPVSVAYGPSYGAQAGVANEGGLQLALENFTIGDVDKDGLDELITPKNLTGSANDDFLIISAVGTWEFEDQGFANFNIEGSTKRLASTHFGGGSPYAIHIADLDGDGKNELVCHNWNFGNYFVIKNTGADTYVMADTTNRVNGDQYFRQTGANDGVSLFGGVTADLDKDGNQEVYFPFYGDAGDGTGPDAGNLHVIDYKSGDNVLKADSTHSRLLWAGVSKSTTGSSVSSFSAVEADLDKNGKMEILVSSSYPSNVVAIEYNGTGAIIDGANYTRKVLYTGEGDIIASIAYRDSLGTLDTVRTRGEGFVTKMSKPMDVDGDGRVEVVLPYQSLADSITYTWQHFDNLSQSFVDDSTKKVNNPKKWTLRMLESDIAGSVNGKDYTMITPDDYTLNQNYPNPFNPTTTINFVLPLSKKLTVRIYDMLGKEVATLVNGEEYAKGSHSVVWNGRDMNGKAVASGSYIATMTTGNISKSIKMMLLK